MTGFIRGLFGGKSKNPGEGDKPVRVNQNSGSFYLDPDDAKTFGDIDYMRSSKTVRRTFAKKAGDTEEKESIRQISAMDSKNLEENGVQPPKAAKPQSTFSQPLSSQSSSSFDSKVKTDTNLDMFRNMAKDMKKR